MRSRWTTLALLGAVVLVASCNKAASTQASDKPDAPAKAAANPLEITAAQGLLERIKIGEPAWAGIAAGVTVAARVDVDEHKVTRVGSPVMGRVTSLTAYRGEEVQRGQLLAVLNSAGLSDRQLDFLRALSQRQLAQRAVERAIVLLNAQVIGSAEVQRRETELAQATAELAAARDELLLLGMPEEAIHELEKTRTINSVARVLASMDGTVLERRITVGQVVQPADTVYEIADLSSVWLVADVPEQIAGEVAVGMAVEAEINAFPGRKIQGRLSFVSATVNPETRTVYVRMELPNPERKYKPAMLATMVLRNPTESRQVIPASAVVREEDLEHVFVQIDADTFVLRPVTLGEEFGNARVLIHGVRPGEKIVVDGAFHLNNERRRLLLRSSEG
jgi:cobalt-zinc-cadmium efflux system membrane fusion protein